MYMVLLSVTPGEGGKRQTQSEDRAVLWVGDGLSYVASQGRWAPAPSASICLCSHPDNLEY